MGAFWTSGDVCQSMEFKKKLTILVLSKSEITIDFNEPVGQIYHLNTQKQNSYSYDHCQQFVLWFIFILSCENSSLRVHFRNLQSIEVSRVYCWKFPRYISIPTCPNLLLVAHWSHLSGWFWLFAPTLWKGGGDLRMPFAVLRM